MSEQKKELDVKEVLKQLVSFGRENGLEIELVGQWIWISGTTKEHAPALKALGLGLKWHAKKKKWFFAGVPCRAYGREQSLEEIKVKYGCLKVA